jgi:hypothetical protein
MNKKLNEIDKELNIISDKITDLNIETNKYVTNNNIDADDFLDI